MKQELYKSPILSTAYFPPVEYMAHFVINDSVTIETKETYPKQTYRNRCRIMTANGCLDLTVPVLKPSGNSSKTDEIEILYQERWNTNHWRAILSAYSNSPFFLYYQDELESFFGTTTKNLVEHNNAILMKLLEILEIDCVVNFTEEFIPLDQYSKDFRFSISPKAKSHSTKYSEYIQVFSERLTFSPNLSILDLIFNMGPESKSYLKSVALAKTD